nr:hypothetical protein CFP56_21633 [Quercus suber]
MGWGDLPTSPFLARFCHGGASQESCSSEGNGPNGPSSKGYGVLAGRKGVARTGDVDGERLMTTGPVAEYSDNDDEASDQVEWSTRRE